MVSYCVSAFRSDFRDQYAAEIETITSDGAAAVTLVLLEALIRVRSEPTRTE